MAPGVGKEWPGIGQVGPRKPDVKIHFDQGPGPGPADHEVTEDVRIERIQVECQCQQAH